MGMPCPNCSNWLETVELTGDACPYCGYSLQQTGQPDDICPECGLPLYDCPGHGGSGESGHVCSYCGSYDCFGECQVCPNCGESPCMCCEHNVAAWDCPICNPEDPEPWDINYHLDSDATCDEADEDMFIWWAMVNHGSSYTIVSYIPEKPGYEFKGWATTPNSSTVQYNPGAKISEVTSSIDLYPVWIEIQDPNIPGGTTPVGPFTLRIQISDDNSFWVFDCYDGDEEFTVTASPFKIRDGLSHYEGLNFVGWTTEKGSTNIIGRSAHGSDSQGEYFYLVDVSRDMTLYPVWEKSEATIFTKVSGSYKPGISFIKVDNQWKQGTAVYTKVGNEWKKQIN